MAFRVAALGLALGSMFLVHQVHAQMMPGYGVPDRTPLPNRGFSVTTPGQYPTSVIPNGVGGYTARTPGQPSSSINPNGLGGYTVMTPGRPPSFIRPND